MPSSPMERRRLRAEVDRSVVELFRLVTEAVSRATTALVEGDLDLARAVVEQERSFDQRSDELAGLVKEGLAGAAEDPEELEALVGILQVVPELERSADLAEHVARRTLQGLPEAIGPESRSLVRSAGDVAVRMWEVATRAYEEHSRDAGIRLAEDDEELDLLAGRLVVQGREAALPGTAVDLALVARFYERLGDHAVNLARRVDTMAAPRRLATGRFHAGLGSSREEEPGGRKGVLAWLRRLRFTPTDQQFFDLFREAAENAREGAGELAKLTASFGDVEERCERIRAIEHRGDQLTVEVLRRLDTSFVTPYDREDIHALTEELDDVVDHVFSAASLIQLAKVTDPLPELQEQTATLVAMADEMEALMVGLRSGKGARHRLERIEHLEREGDAIFRRAMGRLFSGEYAALEVIVWKDIVQAVEDSLNAIEDVSDVVESILVKNS